MYINHKHHHHINKTAVAIGVVIFIFAIGLAAFLWETLECGWYCEEGSSRCQTFSCAGLVPQNKPGELLIEKPLMPCTKEAMLCPDGSTVGRIGPKCEFASCPENKVDSSCGDGICQDMACLAIGCPEPETAENCPQDCKINL
ncbi:MAG TPA: hypothetical protein DIT25_00685 [Candidatus Moranbacteria bacterium]|nr:hypothetical protein [Candidatus Moranbacteria bacterium]